jgi:hypothetical protein
MAAASNPSKGLQGMSWQSLTLTGIVDAPSGSVATLEGMDSSFLASAGDRLANATVVQIDRKRGAVMLHEQAKDNVAGYREVILLLGRQPIVREPREAEPLLKAPADR